MTKFKQGDRVVPERFEGSLWIPDMQKLIGVPGDITRINDKGNCMVHELWWPPSALRPASMKWEPVTGQEVEFYSINRSQWKKGIYYATIDGKHLIVANNNDPALIKDIRPIAPSMKDELKQFCDKYACKPLPVLTAYSELMAIFNRQKEGEGR